MKKYIVSLIVVLSLLTACKGDDVEKETTIEGTWKLTAWKSANAYDFNGDGQASTNLLNELNCYDNELIIFNANGSGIIKSNSYAEVTATLVTGSETSYTYTIDCVETQDNSFFTWSRNGNTISLTENDETDSFNLDNNNFSFLVKDYRVANNQNHQPVVIEDLIFVYTKQ